MMQSIFTNIAYAAAGLIALPILAGLVVVSFIANALLWVVEKVHP
jgi:hypothetical protein